MVHSRRLLNPISKQVAELLSSKEATPLAPAERVIDVAWETPEQYSRAHPVQYSESPALVLPEL
jgi:hypothetical protein